MREPTNRTQVCCDDDAGANGAEGSGIRLSSCAATQRVCSRSNQKEKHGFLSPKWYRHCGSVRGLGGTTADDDVVRVVGQHLVTDDSRG